MPTLTPSPVAASTRASSVTGTTLVLDPDPRAATTGVPTPAGVGDVRTLNPSPAATVTVAPGTLYSYALTPSPAAAVTSATTPTLVGSRVLTPAPVAAVTAVTTVGTTRVLSISPVAAVTSAPAAHAGLTVVGPRGRGLLLRGVGGSRTVSIEPFLLGPAGAVCVEPFGLLGSAVLFTSEEPFWMVGPASAVAVEPFGLLGPLRLVSAEPFEVLDGTVGLFAEGGLVMPTWGVWEPD